MKYADKYVYLSLLPAAMPLNQPVSRRHILNTLRLGDWNVENNGGWFTFQILELAIQIGCVQRVPSQGHHKESWYCRVL